MNEDIPSLIEDLEVITEKCNNIIPRLHKFELSHCGYVAISRLEDAIQYLKEKYA